MRLHMKDMFVKPDSCVHGVTIDLNMLYQGVPVYLEPVTNEECSQRTIFCRRCLGICVG